MRLLNNIDSVDKTVLDVISVGTVVATVADILPSFAAILTIVWTGLRIYETDTIQSLLGKKKNGKTSDPE
jgi:hypothetical protein